MVSAQVIHAGEIVFGKLIGELFSVHPDLCFGRALPKKLNLPVLRNLPGGMYLLGTAHLGVVEKMLPICQIKGKLTFT